MKHFLPLLLIVLCFAGCKSKYERNLQKMEETLKQEFQDISFKNNASIDFLEFKTFSYDTITQNDVDFSNACKKTKRLQSGVETIKKLNKKMRTSQDNISLYSAIGGSDLARIEQRSLDEYRVQFDEEKLFLENLELEIRALIDSSKYRKNPQIFFQSKTYVKIVITNDDKTTNNLMDTMFHFFDANLKLHK